MQAACLHTGAQIGLAVLWNHCVLQAARIDVAAIKQHPWFKRPLPPAYANALAELQHQQVLLDQQAAGGHQNSERDRALEVRLR